MNFLNDDKPIIACSTGYKENTAIAVIRISGFDELSSLQAYFSKPLNDLKPRCVLFTELIEPTSGSLLDEVLLTFFKSPYSYNGENILEISCHGNQLNIQRILDAFIQNDEIRMAQNGEFTYRALRNKKLQLSQVEGLDLFLNSQTQFGLSQGLELLNGQLHEKYQKLYDALTDLKASVELLIDFSEDVGEEQAQAQLNSSFQEVSGLITSLARRLEERPESLTSPEVVLGGRTNAGKSTLFNLLLDEKRAITSVIAGTTRDFLSESLLIDQNHFRLIDTAGIRETQDSIEKEGVLRSFESLEKAFFRIYVADPSNTSVDDILNDLKLFEFDLILLTHADKIEDPQGLYKTFRAHFPQLDVVICDLTGSMGPQDFSGSIGPKLTSSLKNSGPMGADSSGSIEPENSSTAKNSGSIGAAPSGSIEPNSSNFNKFSMLCFDTQELREYIHHRVIHKFNDLLESDPLILGRHRQVLGKLFSELKQLQSVMDDEPAIVSAHINKMCFLSGELIGFVDVEDVLSSVFSKFCIGK